MHSILNNKLFILVISKKHYIASLTLCHLFSHNYNTSGPNINHFLLNIIFRQKVFMENRYIQNPYRLSKLLTLSINYRLYSMIGITLVVI